VLRGHLPLMSEFIRKHGLEQHVGIQPSRDEKITVGQVCVQGKAYLELESVIAFIANDSHKHTVLLSVSVHTVPLLDCVDRRAPGFFVGFRGSSCVDPDGVWQAIKFAPSREMLEGKPDLAPFLSGAAGQQFLREFASSGARTRHQLRSGTGRGGGDLCCGGGASAARHRKQHGGA